MSNQSRLFLSNGKSYTLKDSADSIVKGLSDSKKEDELQMHQLTLSNGQSVYVNAYHVIAIEAGDTDDASYDSDHSATDNRSEESKQHSHEKENVAAAKQFKEDLDGNMD